VFAICQTTGAVWYGETAKSRHRLMQHAISANNGAHQLRQTYGDVGVVTTFERGQAGGISNGQATCDGRSLFAMCAVDMNG